MQSKDRYFRRKKQLMNEKYGKELFMLTCRYIQNTEGKSVLGQDIEFKNLNCEWLRICERENKFKKGYEIKLDINALSKNINDRKEINKIRVSVFGFKKLTFITDIKNTIKSLWTSKIK